MADAANAFERVHHKLTPALLIQRIEEQKTELIYVLEKVGRVRREVKERTNTVAAYVSRKAAYEKLNEKLHRSSSLDAEKKAQLAHKLAERKEQLTKAGEALQTSTSSILHEMCDLQARRPILVRSVFETLLRCQQKHAEDTARRLAPLLAEFPDEESVACSVAAVGDGTQAVLAPAMGWTIFCRNIAAISSGMAHIPLPICARPAKPQARPTATLCCS
jgi:hypothetical protein